jgi:DnaJ-class molecular chaperone
MLFHFQLKSLAFGGSKTKKSSASKKKPVVSEVPGNWNEWKQRDQEFVQTDFEAQLQEAIMASKVDFEANKKDVLKLPENTVNKPSNKKKGGNSKTKGTTTMSLDQFKQGPQVLNIFIF